MLAILAVVVGLLLGLPPALGSPHPSDPYAFSGGFVGFSNLLVLLAATFFASDSLAGEFAQKTAYLSFPNPVRRSSIFFGKVVAGLLASEVIIGLYFGVVAAASLGVTGRVVQELGFAYGLAALYGAAALGLAFFVSALMKGTTGAMVLTFLLFLLILPIANTVLSVAAVKPTFLLTFAATAITNIVSGPYPGSYPTDTVVQAGPGFTLRIYVPDVGQAIAVMVAYLVASLVLALLLFRRRELTG